MGGVSMFIYPSVCLSVCLSVACLDLTRERKGCMEAHHMGNPCTYLEVKRSKVKITRPINAVTDNAAYEAVALQFS